MATTVRRDPYARGEYKRFTQGNRSYPFADWTCDWCGQNPVRLYSYVWWRDGGREPDEGDLRHWFCHLECHDAYPL